MRKTAPIWGGLLLRNIVNLRNLGRLGNLGNLGKLGDVECKHNTKSAEKDNFYLSIL